jgi:hypothetical protein
MPRRYSQDEVDHFIKVWRECGHSSIRAAKECGISRRGLDSMLNRLCPEEKAAHHHYLSQEEIMRRLGVWESTGRNRSRTAKILGISHPTLDAFLINHGGSVGQLSQSEVIEYPIPKKGKVQHYVITCAQNNTNVHSQFWENLKAFATHLDATILVSLFTYQKTSFNTAEEKAGNRSSDINQEVWFPNEVKPYVVSSICRLAPTLAFCANMQISPTAVNPLSGLHDYTGEASTIVPHPTIRMEPVGTARNRPTKHLYTTGAATLMNYIQRKAGQKAEFHHVFGALLVSVCDDGRWFVRQLDANKYGEFADAGTMLKVSDGQVTRLRRVAAIQWGDIHERNLDPNIRKLFWGKGGVLDYMRPKVQIMHDLVDGETHNPHERSNHHKQFELHVSGKSGIAAEFSHGRKFVDEESYRPWCETWVIWSNHDEFIRRHIQATDYRKDPTNAIFILELELEAYRAIARGEPARLFETALGSKNARVFNDDGEPVVIEGITVTMHGHVGVGGSRGSVAQFAKTGAKTATGHSHGAWWVKGATSAGTCSLLDMGYNKGLSPWSHTFTVIFEGGKRQQITADAENMRFTSSHSFVPDK